MAFVAAQLVTSFHVLRQELGEGYFLRGLTNVRRPLLLVAASLAALSIVLFEFFCGSFDPSRPLAPWVAGAAAVLALLMPDVARSYFSRRGIKNEFSVETPISSLLRNPIFSVTRWIADGITRRRAQDSVDLHSRQGLKRLGLDSWCDRDTARDALVTMFVVHREDMIRKRVGVNVADIDTSAQTQRLFYLLVKYLGRQRFFVELKRYAEEPQVPASVISSSPAATPWTDPAPAPVAQPSETPRLQEDRRVLVGTYADRLPPDPDPNQRRATDA